MATFQAEKTLERLIDWVRTYFEQNAAPGTKAVIGISGGKDSSVAAAVCARALGRDRVLGVLMPQGEQSDISFSHLLVQTLGIPSVTVNIGATVSSFFDELKTKMEPSRQALVNTPARIRMTTLYAVAATVGGRVVNTCNLSEDWVGYSTKFGDAAGDFSPLSSLTVSEVKQIGKALGLPDQLINKTPTDGLSGKTDEENLGFTYQALDDYIRGVNDLSSDPALKQKIDTLHQQNLHKLLPMPKFEL